MKTIIKLIFLLLGINSSIISAQTNFNQGIRLENGSDLNFQGYSVNQLDAGDIIFSKYTNQEMARIRSEYYGANNGASIIFSTTPLIKDTFTFSSTGNLGIGISNPQAGIDIFRSYDTNIPKAIKIMYQGSWGTAQYASNYRFIDIQSTEEGNILAVNAYGMGIGFNPPSYSSPDKLYINGNVGIGTTNPTSKLTVAGNINSREVKVTVDAGADFVFKKDYNLPTLQDVEKHINEKGHLENIPNEEEVLKNGINLGEMNAKLLQKIEELTLYIIQQEKKNSIQTLEIEKSKNEIETLKKENESFKNILDRLSKIEEKLK